MAVKAECGKVSCPSFPAARALWIAMDDMDTYLCALASGECVVGDADLSSDEWRRLRPILFAWLYRRN